MKRGRTLDKVLLGVGIAIAALMGLVILSPFLLVGVFYLLIAQTNAYDAAPDRLMVINQSTTAIHSVTMNDTPISDGTLSLGDDVTVEWEQWPGTVAVYGEEGLLGELHIAGKPDQDLTKDCWYVIVQDGPEGLLLGLSHAEKLEQRMESMGERVYLDVTGGAVELYYAPGRGINGDGFDFMTLRFTEEEAAMLEAQMADALGWHPYTGGGLVDHIFYDAHTLYKDHRLCRDFNVPRFEEGWYFFRDTYNSQHGDNDENQWVVEGRTDLPHNYTAALYDSATHTLYIYDSDS